jgi:hypothetical protein
LEFRSCRFDYFQNASALIRSILNTNEKRNTQNEEPRSFSNRDLKKQSFSVFRFDFFVQQPCGCGAYGDAAGLAQLLHGIDPGNGNAVGLSQGLDGFGDGRIGVVGQEDPADLVSANGLAKLLDAHDPGAIHQLSQQVVPPKRPVLGADGRKRPMQSYIIAKHGPEVKNYFIVFPLFFQRKRQYRGLSAGIRLRRVIPPRRLCTGR